MYLWNVLVNLVLYMDQMGSPARYLIPVCFVLAALIQFLCLAKGSGKIRWLPAALFAAITLMGEVSLWLIHSYTALLVIVVMHFSLTALLGALAGLILYKLWTKVHHS